ncbi:MAG TPA: class I SAM-dependent methyltransferase [Thermoanaerobaculia bacterium]|nr:class I SAM-dependent methyltransferase [Thermoanaerobaculia bacterium]
MDLGASVRGMIPEDARRTVRLLLTETPLRIRDALPDVLDFLGVFRRSPPLPPPRLRRRVGRTSSRREFVFVGRRATADLRAAFESARDPGAAYGRWLDFGCGAGRISRFVAELPIVRTIWGVDVDEEAIRWNGKHLPGDYLPLTEIRSLPFPDGSFDVVVSISVFSHFDEGTQRGWLNEVHRVLRPGGLFLASTHSDKLRYSRPDLTFEQHEALNTTGFLFASGVGTFKSDSSFHTRRYLEEEWGRLFRIRLHREYGLAGFQDLSVWERAADAAT